MNAKLPAHVVNVLENNELRECAQDPLPWIWDGVIRDEAITLLSAPEKTGKTTLLSLLLDRRREGGQLLGRPVRPGKTILCSEEVNALWAARQPPLDFGAGLTFCRPAKAISTRKRWRAFINYLLSLGCDAFDLLVIDTAMHFLPFGENNPPMLRWALHELRIVADAPAGILLLHQASSPRDRSKRRGTLAAYVDFLIDMRVAPGNRSTRRRHFDGVGRYPGALQHVAAELNADGTDYLLPPDDVRDPQDAPNPVLDALRQLLAASPEPLTRQEILARWPGGQPPPANTLWRALTRECETGRLARSGAGTKGEPFRYEAC